jgi:hypothetical protein
VENGPVRLRHFNPLRFSLPPKKVHEDRQSMIAKAAYFRAERRDFRPGHELEDWLAAEAEVDQQLAKARLRENSAAW